MIFDWYRLFNLDEWEAEGLVSRRLTVNLEDRGVTEIDVFRGFQTNLRFDDVLLPVGGIDGEESIYVGIGGQYAVFLDDARDVYIGLLSDQGDES